MIDSHRAGKDELRGGCPNYMKQSGGTEPAVPMNPVPETSNTMSPPLRIHRPRQSIRNLYISSLVSPKAPHNFFTFLQVFNPFRKTGSQASE